MPTDNSHLIVAAPSRRATATPTGRRHFGRMDPAGTAITFETLTREAAVTRNWLL